MLAAVAVLALLVWGAFALLGNFTHHGEAIPVPDLVSATPAEAEELLSARGLRVEVSDTIFNDELPRGTVMAQDPRAGQNVKKGRKIYITMNADEAKEINMPDLVNKSKRQALSILEIVGLKLGSVETKPDPCLECVLQQLYKGMPIKADAPIRRGEAVTLVLGAGSTGAYGDVPDLLGKTMDEARDELHAGSFNLGLVNACKGCNTSQDSSFAKVYAQAPEAGGGSQRSLGSVIDIWLTTDTTDLGKKTQKSAPVDNFDFGQ